jgi:hypothetical protein
LVTGVFGENLVDGGAIQIALLQGVVTVKDEGNVFTIVDVAFSADSPSGWSDDNTSEAVSDEASL